MNVSELPAKRFAELSVHLRAVGDTSLKDILYFKYSTFMCRVGQLVGEFESMFLSDLENGKLPVSDLYCGLEGESPGCAFWLQVYK